MNLKPILVTGLLFLLLGCGAIKAEAQKNHPDIDNVLQAFTSEDGQHFIILKNGKLYLDENGLCTFIMQYFIPGFTADHYVINNHSALIILNDNNTMDIINNYFTNFNDRNNFTNIFIKSALDTHLFWTNFTMQSPNTPNVSDYVTLMKNILNSKASFTDNKLELIPDSLDPESSNKVLHPSTNLLLNSFDKI